MKERKKYSDKKKNTNAKRHLLSLLLLLVLAAAAFVYMKPVFFTDTRAILVDGKRFAFIRAKNMNSDEFNLLLQAKLKERYGKNVEINEKVELKPSHAAKKNISTNVDVVIANLCDVLSVKGECGAILVEGERVALLKSTAEAEQVLKDVLDKYTPDPIDGDESKVIGTAFTDEVKVEPFYADSETVLSSTQAYELLTRTREEIYEYTVKAGDSFNGIANKFGTTEEEMLNINPDLTEQNKTLLQIGQKIKVKTQVPVYGISTVMLETEDEVIPIPEEKIENLSQYKTYRKVVSEGSEGKKTAAYKVYYENGIEVKREPDPEHDVILTEAVPRKVEVGTLERSADANSAVGNFQYPIHEDAYFSSPFGDRNYGSGHHYGIDIAAPAGTPVYASDGGVVVHAGWNSGGYGNWVVIDHQNGFKTVYAHNSAVIAYPGQRVHQGQLLALVGSTGDSTGNHLHFEIRLENKPRDPLTLLA